MTIEAWNIVLSVVIVVLLTGGGLWLKYVVTQQLKSKDTAIEALKGVITLKDAHIASLQGDTAPAIVKAYADMRRHADQVTADYLRLSQATEEQQNQKELVKPKLILAAVHGLMLASNILNDTVWKLVVPDGQTVDPKFLDDEFDSLLDQLIVASDRINQTVRKQLEAGMGLLDNIEKQRRTS